jgi:hypothetical protein
MNISRRLLWLNGIAILAVAIHHAAGYSLQAMFEWAHFASGTTAANYDQLGSITYYILMAPRLLLTFAGAAFFFISGYFVGILAKGSGSSISWSMVFSRIKLLFIPFVLWTIVRYVLLRQFPTSIDDILTPYHWIPLLIQFYLISPFIVRLAKWNWKLLLLAAALIGWFGSLLAYLAEFGWPPADGLQTILPNWFFLVNLPFWFPFGVVFGIYWIQFKPQLVRYRWFLLGAAVVMTILVVVEYALVDQLTGPAWLGSGFGGFTKFPYSLLLILSFLAFEKNKLPFAEEISHIGTKSLGIYLGNIPSVYVTALLMYHLTPWLLGYQLVYFVILVLAGLGIPLLLMEAVKRSPVRHRYRVLFG